MVKKLVFTEDELPQRSDEWLQERTSSIGGSEIASILGISDKIDPPQKAWKRKTGKLKPKTYTPGMQRGHDLENAARQAIMTHLTEHEGITNPVAEQFFVRHPEYEYLAVSYDGVDIANKFITEIKCPAYSWNFKSVLTDGIQDYYYPQVQLQLEIAKKTWGIDKAYFGSYFPAGVYILDQINFIERHKTLAVIDIEYDEEFCIEMMKVAEVFWEAVTRDYWDQEKYDKTLAVFKNYYDNRK